MSLMSRLLLSILLLNSVVFAKNSSEVVEDYLQTTIAKNPNLSSTEVNVVDTIKVDELAGWTAYIVKIDATLKKEKRKVSQKMIWFSNGKLIVRDFNVISSGDNLSSLVKPPFQDSYYKKENLISGNINAKHKIAIFSDPLCPFCRNFVPQAVKYMKKEPNKFAIYYYHLPLPRIHPASITLVKAELAGQLQGHKNILLDLYKTKVNPREKDVNKILIAFNKATGLKITVKDIQSKAVLDRYNSDLKMANNLMVQGTPTMFIDGKMDRTKTKYKKIK